LNTTPSNGAIRMGDWKLVLGGNIADSEDGGGEAKKKGKKKNPAAKGADVELFNLASDPNEKTNLAAAQPEKVAELRAKLAELAAQAVPPKSAPQRRVSRAPRVWGQERLSRQRDFIRHSSFGFHHSEWTCPMSSPIA
jgi:arylsulfatase A-like enzyme